MGLLGLFGTKQLESNVSVARAEQMFSERLLEEEKKLCKKCNSQRSAIIARLNEVRAAFAELGEKSPDEKRAEASKAVKDRFVEKAMTIISEFNAREFSSLSDIERFVAEIEKRIDEIRISPREAMHVRFFFEESSAKIAGQLNELVRAVGSLKKAISPLSQARIAVSGALGDYHGLKRTIAQTRQHISSIEKDRATALSRKISPKPFDPSGLNKLRAELKALESKRDLVWQALDSYFSGADKVLRKWAHVESEKDNLALIEKYLSSPHRAVFEDRSFRIKSILTKALSKSEEIKLEEKDVLKTENLLSMADEISRLRLEDEQMSKQIEFVRQMLKGEEILESQHKGDVDRARAIEKALSDQMTLEGNLRGEIERLDEESVKAKLRLEAELSKFLGQKVTIYDEVAVAD